MGSKKRPRWTYWATRILAILLVLTIVSYVAVTL